MEEAGIPATSVFVRAFGHIPELMGLSRSLIVQHPMGRPLGAPGDEERQAEVVRAALDLLAVNEQTITEFPASYRVP